MHLLLCDAAQPCKLRKHGNVRYIVQFAENAELRELRDAGEEYKFEVGVAIFQRRVEVAHDLPEHRHFFLFVHHVEQRCIVLVNQHDYLFPCFLVNLGNEVFQSDIGVGMVGFQTKFPFIFLKNIDEIILQLLFLHVF